MITTRLEYKYYVPREIYPCVLKDIELFCEPDAYSNCFGYYEIDSIYFDNLSLNCYFDRLDGYNKKVKFRLRTYTMGEEQRFFVEMKHKVNEKNLKNKTEIDKHVAASMLDRRVDNIHSEENDVQYFQNILRINSLYPFVRITYRRKAFFYRHYKDLRITFDYNIRCGRFTRLTHLPIIPVLSDNQLILEIKSKGQLPWWILTLIKKYKLKKQSISKYLLSVQAVAKNSSFCLK